MSKGIKKLYSVFKKRYGQILLGILLLVICILSLRWGEHLLSNDNYSPELNPKLSIERYLLSPAWRGYRVLGFASDSEQADIFRSIGLFLLDLLFPSWSLAQLFALFCLCVGTFSMATLTTYFVRDFVNTKSSSYIFFMSGLIYISTLWTAWTFNFNMMPYITQYGALPLLLLAIYLFMKDVTYKRAILLLVTSIFFTSTTVIGTLFFVNVVIIGFFFIYFGILHRVKIKWILKGFAIFLLTQIFWLLPFILYSFSVSSDVISSYTNRSITANTIDLEKQMMTTTNSARLYTRLLGTVDDADTNTYIFPMSEEYMNYDFYRVVGLIPIFLAVLGIIFTIAYKKYHLLPLWILLFGSLFIIKNQNPPLGEIYIWLQETFGIFKQVFRWVSSKMGQQYLVLLTMTSTIGLIYFLNFLSSFFSKIPRYIFVAFTLLIFTLPLLLYNEYLFKGDLFTQRATVSLPQEYYRLREFLKNDPNGRIYYAPPANNGYFREYNWGFVGSQFISYIIPNPVMDMSLSIGSDVGEDAMLEMNNSYNSGNVELFENNLYKYNVKYILVDRSLVKGRYGYALDWDVMDKYTTNWEKVWSDSFLTLYTIPGKKVKYKEYYSNSSTLPIGSFVRKEEKEPRIAPMTMDLSNSVINNNYLEKRFKYTGLPTTLFSAISRRDILDSPIYVKKDGNKIVVSPALPVINGIKNPSFKQFFVPDGKFNYYIVDTKVLSKENLEEGVFLNVKYGDITKIHYVGENIAKEVVLNTLVKDFEVGDCSGGEFTILPNMEPEVSASGFKLDGYSKSPCVYTNLRLDKRMVFVTEIKVNWEPSVDTTFGYCIYSENKKKCLNEEKYFFVEGGSGTVETVLPEIIERGDKLSLSIYALNTKDKRVNIVVRSIDLRFYADMGTIPLHGENIDNEQLVLPMTTGSDILLSIPILKGDDSYIYSSKSNKNVLWEANQLEDGSLLGQASYVDGMKQVVQNQSLNQYQNVLSRIGGGKYLWHWSGENISNIPASVCLTYQGDDKCWVSDIFFDGQKGSVSKIFSSLETGKYSKLDASYSSISFADRSENVLKDFVVMGVPESWLGMYYSAPVENEYMEVELKSIGRNTAVYVLGELKENLGMNTIVSIPEAKSPLWVAMGVVDGRIKLLNSKQVVYVNGWKQGWDTYGVRYDNIVVFYWPNLLSYLGYVVLFVVLIKIVNKMFKRRMYAR